MTTRSKSPPCPGDRRKTFTGCWTCRTRRLRCDETKPACTQCTSKNLTCGGYAARLQWLPPKTNAVGEQTCSIVRTQSSQRRQILASIPTSILGEAALDRELNAIDAEECLSSCRTRVHGPFSVFCANASPYARLAVSRSESALDDPLTPAPAAPPACPTEPTGQEPCWPSIMGRASVSLDPAPNNMADTQDSLDEFWGAADTEIDYIWPIDQFPPSSPAFPSLGGLLAPTGQYEDSSETPDDYASPSQVVCVEPAAYGSDLSLTTYLLKPTFMTDDKRFLINHYVTSVVHIFSVAQNCKSPWRTLHLPRALQGSAELEATGTTPNARNALLHTVLSVSAYNLVNKYRIQGQETSAKKWCQKALQMRFRAVNLLKSCLQENLTVTSKRTFPGKPKYKELLASMLSMITIDVVCGDTSSCRIHLKGCESLIRSAKRGGKTKFSSKARALHRIFYYLRVIHASTALSSELVTNPKDPSATSGMIEEQQQQRQQQHQDKLSSDLKEAESWLGVEQLHPSMDDMSSCEFVYGFPLDLLRLMGRTTGLAQQVNLLRRKQWDLFLIPSLAETCDKLEAEVLEWPVDARLAGLSRAPMGPETRSIVEHQTRAVHKALIIYFSRHIRLMHRQHLQPYVESVIAHMEAAEKIKEDARLIAGPMTWQCFIAASEALGEPLQKRFLQWFAKTRAYGMEAGSRGREIVVEVWNRRRLGGSDVTTDWRRVVEAKTAYLMLT